MGRRLRSHSLRNKRWADCQLPDVSSCAVVETISSSLPACSWSALALSLRVRKQERHDALLQGGGETGRVCSPRGLASWPYQRTVTYPTLLSTELRAQL